MTQFACFACHGLAIGYPIDDLAAYLNANTPGGIHFNVVGGADPQPLQSEIEDQVVAAIKGGAQAIFIGHSKGAMLTFYLADYLKTLRLRAPLFVSLDSTDWGSNAPDAGQWSLIPPANDAGQWFAPDSVDRWLHFSQPSYPGGGRAQLAGGNAITSLTAKQVAGADHLSLPNMPEVRRAVLAAVMALRNDAAGQS
jgi:hypothetical protein